MDNNIKRQIRTIAIGKKKWLFTGSDNSAHRAAAINLLLNTAVLNDINPERYQWLALHDQNHLKRLAIETFGHKQINVAKVFMGNCDFISPPRFKGLS
jgi:hypothetical protein